MNLEALIARLRDDAYETGEEEMQLTRDLRTAADALERIQKMQPVAWMNTTHYADVTMFTRRSEEAERWGTSAVPLYRKGE
jgi:DNA-directed RNA polymerase subunit H (RpoH/RPB5)